MVFAFNPRRLDVAAFAQAAASLSGQIAPQDCARLLPELRSTPAGQVLHWQAQGERRRTADGILRTALHLQVHARLPLTCQRCLDALEADIVVDRHFIFMADEAAAAALDDECDDDVLVQAADFDLYPLIEDEVLMALPLVPRHDACPDAPALNAETEGFAAAQAQRAHPFAALAGLKAGKPPGGA